MESDISSWARRLSVSALFAATACTTSNVRERYAHDFGCFPHSVTETHPYTYDADGCAGLASYRCPRNECYPVGGVALYKEQGGVKDSAPKQAKRGATRKKNANGQVTVVLVTPLEGDFRLGLETDPSHEGAGVRARLFAPRARFMGLDECQLEWMINGERIRVPESKLESRGSLTALSVWVPPEFIGELGVAEHVALKICERRFSLKQASIEEVRSFVALYQEEQAWDREAGEGTGGMMAPTAGWPDWTPVESMPSAYAGEALTGEALFERLAPSVFQVRAELATGTAQGSAVAVAEHALLTNCHVVAGAGKVVVARGKEERRAKVVAASPRSDRCVLEVKGKSLKVIPGVRKYGDLKVGEAVVTIGSPGGLELSLSQGVVSGLREAEDGRRYVQTTAPISPGSSGGGLFDARGNLIGITTLVFQGRKRLNQALNFAVPADSFYEE